MSEDKRNKQIDPRIKHLIEEVDNRLGLEQYILKSYELEATVNRFHETTYSLMMEWLPKHKLGEVVNDLNPDGTAIIQFDFHRQKFEQIIFVGEKSYASKYPLQKARENTVLAWIAEETSLNCENNIRLKNSTDNQFSFQIVHEQIPFYSAGLIEVHFDEQGRILQFIYDGHFPKQIQIIEEDFNLTVEKLQSLFKHQCQYIQWPDDEGFLPKEIYGIKEVFITNDMEQTIPNPFKDVEKPYVYINKKLFWDKAKAKPFERQSIDRKQNICIADALMNKPLPDAKPIDQEEQKTCLQAVKTFMCQKYASDSGKWRLAGLYRERGLIHALLRLNEEQSTLIERKLTILIEPESFVVLNFVDNHEFIQSLGLMTSSEGAVISRDDAYKRLKNHLKVSPYYVYDQRKKAYILCGKLHCPVVVDAHTGELIKI